MIIFFLLVMFGVVGAYIIMGIMGNGLPSADIRDEDGYVEPDMANNPNEVDPNRLGEYYDQLDIDLDIDDELTQNDS